MNSFVRKPKEKMLELTKIFSIERNTFQKLVIIYDYIKLLNTDPLIKKILQKIFNETLKTLGEANGEYLDEERFLSVHGDIIFSNDFWIYYSNLEMIHQRMRKIKKCGICENKDFEDLNRLSSKPYSKEMLELSFKIINSNVFDRINQECFFCKKNKKKKTAFDEEKSILYVRGEKIRINVQDRITNAHKLLKYVFIDNRDNLQDDFYYSEMAEDEFGDLEYTSTRNAWQKYYNACFKLNNKIGENTDKSINDFLIFNSGRKGRFKINPKYLN